MFKPRYISSAIQNDALKDRKIVLISGPRQSGKTTLGKRLLLDRGNYFSWDQTKFRKTWAKDPEKILDNLGEGPVLFDEIHKDKRWKSRIKGLYDTYGDKVSFIVTGSAKMDIYRKGGDSLLGRYIPYRLHPFSVSEGHAPPDPDSILTKFKVSYGWEDLMALGSYPEPLLSGEEKKAQRWSRLRLDRLAYEDTRDLKVLSDLNGFRVLLDLIPEKTGSLFSFNSLKEDVGVAYATVRDWVLLSEALYYGFFVRPYSKNFRKSIGSTPKFYLYDLLQIPKQENAKRLENLTALHLMKVCHFWTDTGAGLFDLFFVRDREKREVDFLIVRDKKPWMLMECRSNSTSLSPHLSYFSKKLGTALNFQLVTKKGYDRYMPVLKTRVMWYEKFFSGLI